jgi:hypothetical protein
VNDCFGGSGASHGDVQSGLIAITPASSFLSVAFHHLMLTMSLERSIKEANFDKWKTDISEGVKYNLVVENEFHFSLVLKKVNI